MPEIMRPRYLVSLNEFAGVIDQMRRPEDSDAVNFTHKDNVSAFGTLAVSPRGKPWELRPCGSPLGQKAWQFTETRYCARLEHVSGDEYLFLNRLTNHRLIYRFGEDSFDLSASGTLPDADQIALDLNFAFLDTRQNDPQRNQFTLKSFYVSETRDFVYVILGRFASEQCILIRSLKNCISWRLRYGDSPTINGFQFIHRFSKQLVPGSMAGAPFDFGIRVSFHDDFNEARDFLAWNADIPLIDLPIMATRCGSILPLHTRHAATAELISPDGQSSAVALDANGNGQVKLPEEGFYRLIARNVSGRRYETVLHAFIDYLPQLGRARKVLQPYFRLFNAEVSSWVRAMCIARAELGPEERMDEYLHDFLIRIGMQGIREMQNDCFGGKPMPEGSRKRIERRSPHHPNHYPHDSRFFIGAPAPIPFKFDGLHFPAGHIYKSHRIQDGFAFIQTYLYAAHAYGCNDFYEYAIRIADAHLKTHLNEAGALERFSPPEQIMIDYTTVVCPLGSIAELYSEMERRGDSRRKRLHEAGVKIADYLVQRGIKRFPTEGTPVFLRWASDGTVASTALSLLIAYRVFEPNPAYLAAAEQALRYHESWRIRTDDVRSGETTWRYWETQWENDGEGHSLNCGHAWSLERAEALFLYGEITGNAEVLRQSYAVFQTNLCNQHPDGHSSSCFTPDDIPERPLKRKLYHCYPERADHALSLYVWERLQYTWFETIVIYDDPQFGPIALNGELIRHGENWELHSFAPHLKKVIHLSRIPHHRVIVMPEQKNKRIAVISSPIHPAKERK